MKAPGKLCFDRKIFERLELAEEKEWLVTNGLGGFASGTIAGSATRRYHGLLIAALRPPLGRMQLVAALDENARHAGSNYALATHRWASGAVDPQGFRLIQSFSLEGRSPVWRFGFSDAVLEKRIWMHPAENTTYVRYSLKSARSPIELGVKALVNYRDFHGSTHAGDWKMNIEAVDHGAKVTAFDGAAPFYLYSSEASAELHHDWYRSCFFSQEHSRGLDDSEDQLFAVNFHATIKPGDSIFIVMSTEENALLDGEPVRQEVEDYEGKILLLGNTRASATEKSLANRDHLLLAADQFIVHRALPNGPDGRTVIAGYHWFGDWSRDTAIALPGLALCTGRQDVARQILLALSSYVDQGMLPNNFADGGGEPAYNSIDASLWYFEAIRQYHELTDDKNTLRILFPVLAAIIEAHVNGTRHNIHVDPSDGLLYGGVPGEQLTWMDAKIGDWVVSPRIGKPVEINALWINALHTMANSAHVLKIPSIFYERQAKKAEKNFQKFWNEARSCCFDVIDSPLGREDALRPNQIFAVSLPISALSAKQQKSVVEVCASHLLTPYGLRSLAPSEAGYVGHYGGTPRERDGAYHQGTVWPWLLGAFAIAHFRVYRDAGVARQFLQPLASQINSRGIGSIGEIHDGDPPHRANGCIAQAWSVAELLRSWEFLSRN